MSGWTSPGGTPEGPGGAPQPPQGPPSQPPPHQPPPPQPSGWGQLPSYPHVPQAARPGIVPLRPLRLGEIYDGAFQAVRVNPAAMVGAAAVIVTVMTAVQLVLQALITGSLARVFEDVLTADPAAPVDPTVDPALLVDAIGTTSLAALASQLVSVVALSLLTAIATIVVGSAVLGRRTSGTELWQRTKARLLPLIGLTILVGLIVAAVVIVSFVPGLLALLLSEVLGVVLLLLGAVGAFVVGVYLDTRLALGGPALVLEEATVTASLRRSWRLTSRGLLRVVGIRLLTYLIVFAVTAIVAAPFQLVGALFGGNMADPLAAFTPTLPQLLLSGLGSAIAATIVYPFFASVTALLYVDQRMRLEGLDVELARAAAEGA
ncbi:MAG: hypothetical protein ACOYXW_03810 [Actinomycetota bacterium]